MKIQQMSFPVIALLALNLVSQNAISAEGSAAEKAASPATPSISTSISLEAQSFFTEAGHETLRNVLANDHYDMSKSDLYDRFVKRFSGLLESTKLSIVAEWRPINLIRGLFVSTDADYINHRKNYLVGLISVCWALVDIAKHQNDFFERGSFTLIDPGHKVAKFLKDYVRLVTGHQDPENHAFVLEKSNFAYRRDPELHGSSHHHGRCPDSLFGIDVRFEPTHSVLMLLPFGYTHIHTGKINLGNHDEELTFVKLEPVGMGSDLAIAAHGGTFIHGQTSVAAESRREKDIDERVLTAFKELLPNPQSIKDFKMIRSMYLEAMRLYELDIAFNKSASSSSTLTASEVGTDIGTFHDMGSPALIKEKAKFFLDLVNQLYPNGNNHLRVGNEVIIDLRCRKA